MGWLFKDFCRADVGVVADLDKITSVRGPYRHAGPLISPAHPGVVLPVGQQKYLSYDVQANDTGGWDFVCNTRDMSHNVESTQIKSSHPDMWDALMHLTVFLQKERTPLRLLGRVLCDGTFNQKSLGATEGEVSLPAVHQSLRHMSLEAN